ncbi:MAG: hypothetical protein FD150_1058 [Rhodobacteraceae bacterium]|nr:MAG: hypothetical protein FD150_1058 [Paracoccaceae bacterium]
MKPTFALDLTREAIGLLHRTPKGWLSIGEVAFDAPDLAEALDYLRKTALGLSPMGVATKLILPNSQILYTEVHAPGPSRDEKRRQIATALEGRTPYAVEDLVFDWSGKGATVKVAVIAKETLAEAEGFAVEHRLNPVSFVAIPEEGTFVGEPWFGPTAAAASLLADDETVERDREPVTILHRELPKAEPVAAPIETPAEPAPAAVDDDPLPGLEEALNAELTEVETPTAADAADRMPEALDDIGEDEPIASLAASPEPQFEATVAASPEMSDLAELEVDAAPVATPVAPPAPKPEPEAEEAPFAHVTDTSAFPEPDDDRPPTSARKLVSDDLDDDLPPAPSSAAMVAFASRRAAAADAVSRPMDGVTRPAASAAAKGAIARPAPTKSYSGLVTAPSIPGTRAKAKVKGGDIPRPALGPTTVKSPARPGGTFGTATPAKKRGGTVFMVLVGLLLLFLALIGLWSSMYLGGTATTNGAAATEIIPDASDEMLADMQDPEGMTGPLPEAVSVTETAGPGALATESLPVNIGGGETVEPKIAAVEPTAAAPAAAATPEPAPEPAVAPAPEPAPGTTVATDVAAGAAPVEDQDEIFLSSMDAPPPALDALALPAPIEVSDALPDPVMPPPAPGTVYKFDARGLLMPTPEGIISPDGVMLIAGKPPLVPPSRSAVASAAGLAAASVPAPAVVPPSSADASLVTAGDTAPVAAPLPPADPAMAGFRPRLRPEGLTPATANDGAALGAAGATDFAVLRPLPRPASVVTAAAVVLPASATPADLGAQGASLTAQAEAKLAEAAALEAQNPSVVAISMRPAARPRDLSRAVEAAVAAAVREPAPEAETIEVAAAAPEAKPAEVDELNEPETTKAAPSIPTKASVAKQATYRNAINLSKINLIGTYGTDSRRYALIRQSNGKYKKVKVGDKIDGGTVKAITETEVRYQKGGRLVSLKMPKA